MNNHVDPITVSVIQARLDTITKEMGETMLRTSRGPIFHEARDFCTSVYDAECRLLAQTEYNPNLLGATRFAVRAIRDFYGDDVAEGDVFTINDPYHGNNHLNDHTVIRPVFFQGQLLFWAAARGHHADIGGAVPGHNPGATEIWQEGVRIPPVRLYRRGEMQRDLWNLILCNCRAPEITRGDLRSQVGATRVAERGLLALVQKYGAARFAAVRDEILNAAERRVRAALREIPSGTYHGQATLDHDGHNKEQPVTVRVKVTVGEDWIEYDYTGSDPQTAGFINSPYPNTYSATCISLFTVIDPDIPHNEGATRPIRVVAPEGTLLNPRFPGPVGICTVTTAEAMLEAGWKALAQAVPQLTSAGWTRWSAPVIMGIDHRTGHMFADILFLRKGGGGAICGYDGWGHIGTPICGGGLRDPDLEMHELENPFTLLEHEYRPESGGAGQWRGGLGVIYRWRMEAQAAVAVQFGDGHRTPPFGLMGGKDGVPNTARIYRAGGQVDEVDSKGVYHVFRGDVYEILSAGGGGWGDPHLRPAELVRADVRNGFISLAAARDDYGVVLDPATLAIDWEATRQRRGNHL